MYGKDTDKDGKKVKSSGPPPIMIGEKVIGNKIASLEFTKDENGVENPSRADLKFTQSNGATFSHSFMDSEENWAIDKTNREMLHICTKLVSEEDYYKVVEGATSFADFINRVKAKIMPLAAGKSFTLKIVYRLNKKKGKWYASFPTYPSFMELDGTNPSTLSTNPKYDFYVMPEATNMESKGSMEKAVSETEATTTKEDLPF